MKIIEVLGLGKTLSCYKKNDNITIGVNDIWKYHKTDYVVVVDPPRVFDQYRFQTIINSKPKKLFSNVEDWKSYNSYFEKINLAPVRHDLKTLDDKNNIPYSNNSTFVACIMAYHLGADIILMHGVDFIEHKNLSVEYTLNSALNDFDKLKLELNKRNVKIMVSSKESKLSQILNIYENNIRNNDI